MTRMRALHQFVPTYEMGAVGAHTGHVQRLARELGFESEIFAEHVHPALHGKARQFGDYGGRVRAHVDDVLVYQLCTGSVVADFVAARAERTVVNYHNITPVEYYAPWEPELIYGLAWGREQLRSLASTSELGLAVSLFNERELVDAGYGRTAISPVLVDVEAFDHEVDESLLRRLESERLGSDWLFVGRISPNKAQHDLIAAFALYRKVFDASARLHLVGGCSSNAYLAALHALIEQLDVVGVVDLAGPVSAGALAAYYRTADVFVCASDHEGFCVPLLEAMHHQVPIVAYGAAAIPDTLSGGSGLLLTDKQPATFATAVHRVCTDEQLRRSLIAGGQARLETLSLDRTRARFAEVISELAGPSG